MLGIEDIRLAGIETEKAGIEEIGAVQMPARVDIVGMIQQNRVDAGRLHLLTAEKADGFDALCQILPESLEGIRTGKTPGQTDDSDVIAMLDVAIFGKIIICKTRFVPGRLLGKHKNHSSSQTGEPAMMRLEKNEKL